MITEQNVKKLVEEQIRETGIFLVEVTVKPGNAIRVQVDSPEGVSIDDCAGISRFLNSRLDRDTEDFSLEVSSPGLGSPFRVRQQYDKHLGKKVDITLNDGSRLEGKLESMDGDSVTLKIKGRNQMILFEAIKKAKAVISFN